MKAFTLTIAVELPVAWLAVVVVARDTRSHARVLLAAALGTVLTHPVLWFVLPAVWPGWRTWMDPIEVGIAIVESVVLWRLVPTSRYIVALLASVAMNAASYGVGLLLSDWLFQTATG